MHISESTEEPLVTQELFGVVERLGHAVREEEQCVGRREIHRLAGDEIPPCESDDAP